MKTGWFISDRFMLLIVISLLLLSVLVLALNQENQIGTELTDSIRELRIKKTRAAVLLSVLQESDQLDSVQADTVDTIESLKLAIIEVLSSDVISEILRIKSSTVVDTDRDSWQDSVTEQALHSLSVTINADAKEADAVLVVLQQLQRAAQWRPLELRSCLFRKTDAIYPVALSCMVDIYYFPNNRLGVNE